MDLRLNEKQQKLVEDNHNLIYMFMNSNNLSEDDIEDWYGIAAIGLCKAALVYDESRGCRFSTLAYTSMNNEKRNAVRNTKKCIYGEYSLNDTPVPGCELEYIDAISDFTDPCEGVYFVDAVRTAEESLSERDREILRMIVEDGLTHKEVADKAGMSRTNVTRIYSAFINKVEEMLGINGVSH